MQQDNITEESPGAVDDPVSSSGGSAETWAAEREMLIAERAELQDLLLRRQADFDNYRRRVEREKAEMRDYASEDAVRALLPILDDFDRGLRLAPEEEGPVRDYARGVELIHQRLTEALVKLGLEKVESQGQRFDPNLHNAIQKESVSGVADQTILEEYQCAYRFKGRLLRPAMVKVAVNP
ncbi:MAG: nucleotide exchange factor GrpE [Bryobacteraceae bacterium]